MTTPPAQVPLYNSYEGPEVEPNNDEDNGPSRLEVSPRLCWPRPHMKTTSIKKKRLVIAIGDPLLRRTERPSVLV